MFTKSQLKIQQMAFMLMAVFIFFVLAGLFWIVISGQNLKKEALLESRNNAIELANVLSSSAEFTCGDYCIDADRAIILGNRTAYRNFWGVKSIELETIYPVNKDITCTLGNYPNCSLIKVYSKGNGKNTAFSYVSLCHRIKENDYVQFKCELGRLIIGYDTGGMG